jgi:hypothetical protein
VIDSEGGRGGEVIMPPNVIAQRVGIKRSWATELLSELVELRIVGRRMRFGRSGQVLPSALWLMDPSKQIQLPSVRRSRRVAELEPAIRQALLDDRQSLREVAKRFGVCADTVLEIRRRVAPYDSDTAQVRRCSECGGLITSAACLRCSMK